jgi:hypothetical protein
MQRYADLLITAAATGAKYKIGTVKKTRKRNR